MYNSISSTLTIFADCSSANADVYLGYTTWSAGGFDATYELTETPTQSNGKWTDTSLVKQCVVGAWKNA
jgi:endoglucanase